MDLDITRLEYLCSFPNTYPYKSVVYPVTDMAFVCEVKTFDTIKARDDIDKFYFVDLAELDTKLFGLSSPKRIIEHYLKVIRLNQPPVFP